jgi:hypothetical protein
MALKDLFEIFFFTHCLEPGLWSFHPLVFQDKFKSTAVAFINTKRIVATV